MAEVKLTKDNFQQEVTESTLPVLVDFWAEWCGPCRMLGPTVSKIAEEYEGRVKVGKVNVDEESELAARFGIAGIPALILFNGGKAVDTLVGLRPKESIEEFLEQVL